MKFSLACRYALRALAYLAAQDNPMTAAHAIARACGLPGDFLSKVFKPLVVARVLYSLKGPNGGYRLARPATQITVLEIVEAVDGAIRGMTPALGAKASAALDGQLTAICDQAADTVRK